MSSLLHTCNRKARDHNSYIDNCSVLPLDKLRQFVKGDTTDQSHLTLRYWLHGEFSVGFASPPRRAIEFTTALKIDRYVVPEFACGVKIGEKRYYDHHILEGINNQVISQRLGYMSDVDHLINSIKLYDLLMQNVSIFLSSIEERDRLINKSHILALKINKKIDNFNSNSDELINSDITCYNFNLEKLERQRQDCINEINVYQDKIKQIENFFSTYGFIDDNNQLTVHKYDEITVRLENRINYYADKIRGEIDEIIVGLHDVRYQGKILKVLSSQVLTLPNVKKRKGLKGLTSNRKKTIKSSCFLLEKKHGKDLLSFVTLTLPTLSESDHDIVCKKWSYLTKRICEEITRELKRKGLSGELVCVTENQSKRCLKYGLIFPHLHITFHGREKNKSWAISTQKIDELWKQQIENIIGHDNFSIDSACEMKRIEKSVIHYMAKYMSKGSQNSDSIPLDHVPKSWSYISNSLRDTIKSLTIKTNHPVALFLFKEHKYLTEIGVLGWSKEIEVTRSGSYYSSFKKQDVEFSEEKKVGVAGSIQSMNRLLGVYSNQQLRINLD